VTLRGARYVSFYDHRSDWRFPDPGFIPPTFDPNVQPASNFKYGYNAVRGPLNQTGQAIATEIQQAPQQTDAQVAATFRTLAARFKGQVAKLKALEPPASVADDWNNVTSAASRLDSDLYAIASAAVSHSTAAAYQAGASLAADAQALTEALAPIKQKLGLK
jgi:hypothetical protein